MYFSTSQSLEENPDVEMEEQDLFLKVELRVTECVRIGSYHVEYRV